MIKSNRRGSSGMESTTCEPRSKISTSHCPLLPVANDIKIVFPFITFSKWKIYQNNNSSQNTSAYTKDFMFKRRKLLRVTFVHTSATRFHLIRWKNVTANNSYTINTILHPIRQPNILHLVQNVLCSRLLSKKVEINKYKTIILPVVLYGCETLSLKLKKEHRLSDIENMVLRKMFGLKRNTGTGGCRKLHHAKLYNLYSTPHIVRIMKSRWMRRARHVARMGKL
jgi:hypothetical protein